MVDEQPRPHDEPPLIDISTRPSPVPGPLTKPAPVIRPPKRNGWWLIIVAALFVLAGLIAGGIAWSNSTQAAPEHGDSNVALSIDSPQLLTE